jgi:hypothetical protein
MVMLMHGRTERKETIRWIVLAMGRIAGLGVKVGGQSLTCEASFHTIKNKQVVKNAQLWAQPLRLTV